jgi:PAS domain S-box-containing protein
MYKANDRDMIAQTDTEIDLLLQRVVAGTAGHIGEDFFRALVQNLAQIMGVKYAFVAEFPGAPDCRIRDRVQTLAFWSRDGFLDNVEYKLAGSPCEMVLAGETRLYEDNVAELFPQEPELKDMGAVSYLAMPLLDHDGEVQGHIAVIDDKPMSERPSDLSLLKVFGARVTAELERRNMEQTLRRSEARLQTILHSTHDAIIVVESSGAITLFNPAAEALFGRSAQQVISTPLDNLLTTPFAQLKKGCFRHSEAEDGRPASLWAPQGIQALAADGKPFPVEMTISPSYQSPGKPASTEETPELFTLILRDISARKRADRELKRLKLTTSYLREEVDEEYDLEGMVTSAPRMQKIVENIRRVAPTDSTVLLNGETGVGKELMARAIHSRSKRAEKLMIKINCAALPADLIESELFGHEAGAFTGASGKRIGRFELADGGTLFLDEVGELTAAAQAKLLRVLQEQEFERVGGSHSIRVNVRVIAATNRDLGTMVADGSFRGDLFYRLNVFPVRIPPLRERREDIPALAEHFLVRSAQELGRSFTGLCPDALGRLQAYDWPGNIRELQNVLERAAILADGPILTVADALVQPLPHLAGPSGELVEKDVATTSDSRRLEDTQRQHIEQVLIDAGWTIEGPQGAAAILGIAPSTLRSRMKKLGIKRR